MPETKTEYQFKPHLHWNYIPLQVYLELQKFYGGDMLRAVVSEPSA